MNDYFVSYNSSGQKEYIYPEVNIISNSSTKNAQIRNVSILRSSIAHATDIRDTYKVKLPFRPWVERLSAPIDMKAYIIIDDCFYEVIEGLYMLNNGTVKMKVKNIYGR